MSTHLLLTSKIVGFLAILFGLTLLIPVGVALYFGEKEVFGFLQPMLLLVLFGTVLWSLQRDVEVRLRNRDGFLIVGLFWIILSFLGAWPLRLTLEISLVDAFFESASGLTTTGATVITGLDDLPKSVLMYRQLLQWLGGMGLIVLGIAVSPMLGIGGMQLYRAEVPGPLKSEKLTPRLTETARFLWLIYLSLTIVCALGYWLAGMTVFDAVAHSLSTVSTGGFSTHDASLGYYQNPLVEYVAVVFMLAAAINFGVHFLALHERSVRVYIQDNEVRSFLLFVGVIVALTSLTLSLDSGYEAVPVSTKNALFEVVSVVTSTGFGIVDFTHWPAFLPMLLIFISFVGGCGGSTAGGIKVMRVLLMAEQGAHEIKRLIHPQAVFPVRIGERIVDENLMRAVWGFFAVYMITFACLVLLMITVGLDETSAFSAVATSMNNLGPGLGEVAYNFQSVSDLGKVISVVAMLLGRLEIFTLLVLLSPHFWQR